MYKIVKTKSSKKSFSKVIAMIILLGDIGLSLITLYLCYLAITLSFDGGLPYLVSLIGAYQIATGYVLGKYFSKSEKENIKGGIVYDTAMLTAVPNNEEKDRDC